MKCFRFVSRVLLVLKDIKRLEIKHKAFIVNSIAAVFQNVKMYQQ